MIRKKFINVTLIIVLILTGCFANLSPTVQAKTKTPTLSKKKITMKVGKTQTIKLKNASRKVAWKVIEGKKYIKITKKSGKYKNVIKIKAKKAGKVVIRAKHGKKTYKVNIKVKATNSDKKTTKVDENPTTGNGVSGVKYATVTFDSLGGTKVDNMTVKIGDKYGKLPIPELIRCEFNGWFTEPYGKGKQILASDICNGDITLYASFSYIPGDIPNSGDEYIENPIIKE